MNIKKMIFFCYPSDLHYLCSMRRHLYILMNTCYIYNKVKKTNSSGVSFSNQTKGFSKKQNKR